MFSKVIPSYAKDFKKEYLFIFDINKRCEKLLKKIDQENVFNSSQAKNLIIYFENLDYFKDINNFYFKHEDVSFIEYLESKLILIVISLMKKSMIMMILVLKIFLKVLQILKIK